MRIQLTDRHQLEYDGMGYILRVRSINPPMGVGEWDIEGFYGDLSQVARGLYRHGVHASGVETVEQLILLQKAFVNTIISNVRGWKAPPDDPDDENE